MKNKHGVVLYIKPHLKSELILRDENGRFDGIEINPQEQKTLGVGVYGLTFIKTFIYKKN